MLTVHDVEKALPPNLKHAATQSLVDMINNATSDPILADNIRENFLSYTGVLREGKFKTEDYLNAVTYVSLKLIGKSNVEAYAVTFPQRYNDLVARGATSKDIAAYVSAYNKGKLVNLITEQSLVPTWVLNQHLWQEALNVQADLMRNATSEKVQCEAANSLLTHLKRPEAITAQLNVDVRDTSGMNELRETLRQMAQRQQELIGQGVSTKEIAAAPIIEGEVVSRGPA